MSGTVDDEVVRMKFDNNAFEQGVSKTISTLDKLKSALRFPGATKGFSDIEAKANRLDMSGANKQIDASSHHWSLWQSAAYIAFATVVHRATNAAINVAKAFTVNPIGAGFKNYETQINAIQTILANTGLKGAAGLKQVEAVLGELNEYANQTVYSFSEMAKNIGTFSAAGVKLQPAADAIKGIANLAALSGSSSDQASTAMYQLSQAIAANKVGLQDWNSVVNAGMGGKIFQRALFNTAKLEGTLKNVKADQTFDQWTKAGNSFRQSLQEGWITGKVLTETLATFTGDLTEAQLRAKGYTKEQAKEIYELSQTAVGAAKNIKTFTQLKEALKEEVASAYGTVFKTIFGDINVATKLFTKLHTVIQNALTGPIYHLNDLLVTASKFGARTSAISAFTGVFRVLGEVIKPIKDAFHQIFPPLTGERLANLINGFDDFIHNIRISGETASKIKRIFAGVFAVFDIGKQIIMAFAHLFVTLTGDLIKGSGGFLEMAASVGDWLVAFDKALKQGDFFKNAFEIIINLVHAAAHIFGIVGAVIAGLFEGFKPQSASGFNNSVVTAGNALGKVAEVTQKVSDFFGKIQSKIKPGVQAVVRGMKRIGEALASAFGTQTFANILGLLQTGLLAGIVVLLKKFLSNGLSVDLGGGFLGKMSGMLDGVTGNLKAMQQELKAKALLEIAIAVGILAASLAVLSLIKPDKLEAALKAMAIGFGALLAAMGILTKITASAGFVKIPIMAASLGLLAGAILILSAAVYALSRLSWEELKKGLTAVGALLAALSLSSVVLSANSAGMIQAGIGITAMAVAMNLLYVAVKAFSMMSWHDMLKGLAGVGIALVGLAIAMRLMPKGMVLQGAALILIATAVNGLYLAIKNFSSLDWKTMIKGLVGMAGALVAIAGAMHLMPAHMLLQAVALIAVGAALQLIYRAVADMAKLSWNDMAHGLAALAGSLGVLAGAMYLMTGTLGGAAALLVVSAALRLFVPSLMALSTMKWSRIFKGLAALALSFAVIGAAGLLLTGAIPGMLALGVALGLVGVAMLAFGAGAALLGIGLTAIAASGGAAIGVIMTALKNFIILLPVAAKNIAIAMVSFITIIGKNAPKIVGAFVSLLTQLLKAVPKIMPSLIAAINSIVKMILTVLTDNAPGIIAAGFELLMDLLDGIKNNIGQVVTTVADIIVKFLDALASNMGRIVAAGVNLLFKFLEGVAREAGKVPGEVIKLIGIFLSSLFDNFDLILQAGKRLIGKLISGLLSGLSDMGSAAGRLIGRFLNTALNWLKDLGRLGVNIIKWIVQGIADAVKDLVSAAIELGKKIVSGVIDGIKHAGSGGITGALKAGVLGGLNPLTGLLFGGPPCLLGINIVDAIAQGIDKNAHVVADSLQNMNKTSVLVMKKTMAGLADAISENNIDYSPRITPILDLSQIQKDAGKIGGLVSTKPIVPVISASQARAISAAREADVDSSDLNEDKATAGITLKLEQNNYSPKALSTVDIYRQTNNAMSLARNSLGVITPN